jgi:hypothetical protein
MPLRTARLLPALGALGCLAYALSPPGASAAEWSVTPFLREEVGYDDNPRLTRQDHESVWVNELDLRTALRYRTELTEATVTPRFRAWRYSAEKDLLDRDDGFLTAAFSHERERWSVTADADLEYRGSRTIDLETAERADVNVDTRDRSASLAWRYLLTERDSLEVAASYGDVTYEDTDTTGLRDYRFSSLSLTGSRQMSLRDSISVTVFGSRFETPRSSFTRVDDFDLSLTTTTESETETLGVQAGWGRAWTETLTSSISAGVRRSDIESVTRQLGQVPRQILPGVFVAVPVDQRVSSDESSDGLVLSASLSQALERWSWELDYSRQLTPQSNGTEVERDRLQVRLERELQPGLTGFLDGLYYEDGLVGDNVDDDDPRAFARLNLGLRARLSRFWTLNGNVRLRRNEPRNSDDMAESNAVFVSVVYNRDRIAWSR